MTIMFLWLDLSSIFQEYSETFRHNLFKPLFQFFSMGFRVPILTPRCDRHSGSCWWDSSRTSSSGSSPT